MSCPPIAALVDDAAMFPPARRPKEEAVAGHRAARAGSWGWLVGRFLCPASALPVDVVRLGVVSDGDWRADLAAAVAAGAEAFELRDPGPEAYAELAAAPLAVFVEGADVAALAAAGGLGAKLRCGGVTADAFPDDHAVAGFVAACRAHGVRFKATAGLHHPFRTADDELGVLQHGFVNLLAAAVVEVDDLEPVIAERDPEAFSVSPERVTWRGRGGASGRGLFDAFGSCSLSEPADGLAAAGVGAEAPARA